MFLSVPLSVFIPAFFLLFFFSLLSAEGVFFVNGARMHPGRWLGLRRENLNQSRRDYDPENPLGVGPARVQKLVYKYLVPLALWGEEAPGVSRDKLLRLGSDQELTLSREEFPLTTSQSWTMGTLSPWTYEDDADVPVCLFSCSSCVLSFFLFFPALLSSTLLHSSTAKPAAPPCGPPRAA